MSKWEDLLKSLTPEELENVHDGIQCPSCKGKNIKYLGCNPDFIRMNCTYECKDCGTDWEGR